MPLFSNVEIKWQWTQIASPNNSPFGDRFNTTLGSVAAREPTLPPAATIQVTSSAPPFSDFIAETQLLSRPKTPSSAPEINTDTEDTIDLEIIQETFVDGELDSEGIKAPTELHTFAPDKDNYLHQLPEECEISTFWLTQLPTKA
ncbi:hypothetical protein Q9L58_010465 [Maublancomyces gigas]|uniref:Uncharacterized protein n=1 Tax=Discina gigas TaxID=1032678 RepID=A0ABR3G510_9PEZI